MRARWIGVLALGLALAGCGGGGNAGASGPVPSGAATGAPAGDDASFCDAALQLEVPMDRAELQRALEAATPAGLEPAVAVIREFMERQARGDNPYQDPDFLDDYNDAVHELWRHCGRT